MTTRKSLEYYLGLKYPITIFEDPDGGYVAKILDLPGCLTQAETPSEIFINIAEARELWIETAYEHGDPIPEPAAAPLRAPEPRNTIIMTLMAVHEVSIGRRFYRDAEGGEGCFNALGEITDLCEAALPPLANKGS